MKSHYFADCSVNICTSRAISRTISLSFFWIINVIKFQATIYYYIQLITLSGVFLNTLSTVLYYIVFSEVFDGFSCIIINMLKQSVFISNLSK